MIPRSQLVFYYEQHSKTDESVLVLKPDKLNFESRTFP